MYSMAFPYFKSFYFLKKICSRRTEMKLMETKWAKVFKAWFRVWGMWAAGRKLFGGNFIKFLLFILYHQEKWYKLFRFFLPLMHKRKSFSRFFPNCRFRFSNFSWLSTALGWCSGSLDVLGLRKMWRRGFLEKSVMTNCQNDFFDVGLFILIDGNINLFIS